MRRRKFITLLGSIAAWPQIGGAQKLEMPVIGFLNARSPNGSKHLVAGFLRGLAQYGYVDGQNVKVLFRWALGHYEHLPAFAEEFVRSSVNLIAATGGMPAALAAKKATQSIPIVFTVGGDPVSNGLVASYSRPGGNATGMSILTTSLETKRLGLLRELLPRAKIIGVLVNRHSPLAARQSRDVREAARSINLQIQVIQVVTDSEIDAAFKTFAQNGIAALLVAAAPFFDTRRDKLVALSARQSIPTMYQFREYAAAGGLMSYGIDLVDAYRQAGVYAGRILKGEKPANLPVMQPTKFELQINLKTANTLKLHIPPAILLNADEVIE